MEKILLTAGAVLHLAFAAFHLFFWKLFDWRRTLRPTTAVNRAAAQVMNLCLVYLFLALAVFSLLPAGQILGTAAGRAVLAGVAGFWLFRAVLQVLFFDRRKALSVCLTLVFLALAALYGFLAVTAMTPPPLSAA